MQQLHTSHAAADYNGLPPQPSAAPPVSTKDKLVNTVGSAFTSGMSKLMNTSQHEAGPSQRKMP